jgi:hypothetical protein
MTFLKSLTFTDALDAKPSPILKKRSRLLVNLREQLSRLNDPTLCRSKTKWVKTDEGKKLIEKTIPVRPWWKETIDGQYLFFMKSGLKRIEFEKGKAAILVANKDAIHVLISGLMEAVQKGEFDHLIEDRQETKVVLKKRAM